MPGWKGHIVGFASNTPFAFEGYQDTDLIRLYILNDLSGKMATGPEMRTFFDQEGTAINVKGGSRKCQDLTFIKWVTSNYPSLDAFRAHLSKLSILPGVYFGFLCYPFILVKSSVI